MNKETISAINILLADDDKDDCFFFEKAINELPESIELKVVHDGEQLMEYLNKPIVLLPDIIFLDLSMPRKTGFECLHELKESMLLKNIPVVMLSTSYPRDINYEDGIIKMLQEIGAAHFIRKPGDFNLLKEAIQKALDKITKKKLVRIDAIYKSTSN